MKDKDKTREQLIKELVEMRRQIAKLEKSEIKLKRAEASKLVYEELDQIFNTAADGMRVIDRDFNMLRINKTFSTIAGISKDEAVGKKCYEVFPGPQCHTPSCPLTLILGGKGHIECEVEKERNDGTRIPCILTATPLRGPGGELIGIVEDFKDITEHKQAEEELKEKAEQFIFSQKEFKRLFAESEESRKALLSILEDTTETQNALQKSEKRFRDIAINTGDWIWETDEKGCYTYCSPVVKQVLGYKYVEVLGKYFYDFFHPDEREELKKAAFEVFKKKEPFKNFINQNVHKNGHTVILKTTAIPMLDDKGNLLGYRGVDRDITEQKRAEEALRESEQHFRSVVQTASDAIITINKDRNIIFWNCVAETIFGYSADEIVGKPLALIMLGQFREAHKKGINRVIATEKSKIIGRTTEVVGIRKDGSEFPVEFSLASWKTKGEIFFTGIIRDITERKKMQEEVLKVQKLESLGFLAGGIAHDFNNILTAILGNISLIKMYVKPEEEVFEILTEAEKASLRAKDLTRQLLTFSRGGAPVKKVTPIPELLKDTVLFALTGSNVKCEFSIDTDLWLVDVDEGQFNQAINNLIINANQVMPEGGTIEVKAENIVVGKERILPLQEGRYIKISIKDQGIGIPKEHLPKIFDPYFTTKQKGSGLGLATTYSIIQKHDGYITVESEVGVGTTVHIYLPASEERITISERETEELIKGEGKILLMDDEDIVLKVGGRLLKHLGYEVEFAKDGVEAIELYKKAKESGQLFNAVIMDLTVPGGMGGKEAIKKLIEIDSGVKAIVSSGYSNDAVMAEYRKYGFSGVITKPYKIEELSRLLHKVIKI